MPTTADGAAVNVGANNDLMLPVGVYVGKRETCVPENDGEIVVGGKLCEEVCAASTVPAPA